RLDEATPVRALRPEVPAEVADLVARLMAREPQDRPASAAMVLEAVAALPRPSPAPILPRPRPRPPRASFFFGLAAALVLGSAMGGVARWARQPASPVAPPVKEERPAPTTRPAPSWHLDEAIASATDGATITVPAGTHIVPPAVVRGKRLIL